VERIDLDRESRPNHKALRYVGGAKNRKNSTNLAKGENPHMVARADAWRVKAADAPVRDRAQVGAGEW